MICNNCKKEISETSKFCRFCGSNLVDEEIETRAESNMGNKIEDNFVSEQDLLLKLEHRRNKSIGIVLLVFSALTVASFFITQETPGTSDSIGQSPLPTIIDIYLGIELLRQKTKQLNWVLWRAILGLILWGLLSISSQDWSGAIIQSFYCSYFIYLIKSKLTENSLKIANYVLLPLTIISLFVLPLLFQ